MNRSYVYLCPHFDPDQSRRQCQRLMDFADREGLAPATVVEEITAPSGRSSGRRLSNLLGDLARPGDCLIVEEACHLAASLTGLLSLLALASERAVTVRIVQGGLTLEPGTNSSVQAATLRLAASALTEFQRGRTRVGLKTAAADGRKGGRRTGSTGRLKLDPHQAEIGVLYHLATPPSQLADRFGVTVKTMRRFLARRFPRTK